MKLIAMFAFVLMSCALMMKSGEGSVIASKISVHSDQLNQAGQRSIAWEIAKLEYYQAKLNLIRDLLVNVITFITQTEVDLLQRIIDALRRLQGMRNSVKANGALKETDEELAKFFSHCDDLIKEYETIEKNKRQ